MMKLLCMEPKVKNNVLTTFEAIYILFKKRKDLDVHCGVSLLVFLCIAVGRHKSYNQKQHEQVNI